jgi:hypothetical protein
MRPPSAAVAALLLLPPLGGCCAISQGLSAIFCGPREPLPRRSYFTATEGLKTFLAAVASDDSRTIFESLGPDLKKRMKIGAIEWEIGWQKIKAATPGIHLADQAEPRNPDPVILPAQGGRPALTSFTLTLPGTTIEVWLRKYAYWKVIYQTADMQHPEEVSRHIPSLGEVMRLREEEHATKIALELPGLPWSGVMESEILQAAAGIEWLVYDFRIVP